jgi:hypothetical protein
LPSSLSLHLRAAAQSLFTLSTIQHKKQAIQNKKPALVKELDEEYYFVTS